MPDQALDLWAPDIGKTQVTTPLAILRSQAALLAQKTNHVLEALVETTAEGSIFRHDFCILAPALDNYKYRLFGIWTGIDLYPIRQSRGTAVELRSEQEFVDWLKDELSSDKTRTVILALLSQSKS